MLSVLGPINELTHMDEPQYSKPEKEWAEAYETLSKLQKKWEDTQQAYLTLFESFRTLEAQHQKALSDLLKMTNKCLQLNEQLASAQRTIDSCHRKDREGQNAQISRLGEF